MVPHPATPCVVEAMATKVAALLQCQETKALLALRSHPELGGWAALDLAQRHDGASWSAREMALLFCHCGRRDAELRDLLGAGHARLLSLAPTRRFDAVMR